MTEPENISYTVHLTESRIDAQGRQYEHVTALEVDPDVTVQQLVRSLLSKISLSSFGADRPDTPDYVADPDKHITVRPTAPTDQVARRF